MAGAGSRFSSAGFVDPKPLIPISGKPMIKLVIENLTPSINHRFIFICQNSHIRKYDLEVKLNTWSPGCKIIGIDGVTEGAACTVLKAKDLINDNNPLMIANSDQFIDTDIDDFINKFIESNLDGMIMTMKANNPKWSFIDFDQNNIVTRVVEKEVISDEATVGIYTFRKGNDFIFNTHKMIHENKRVNNEFYVAPVYNEYILSKKNIGYFNIGSENDGMYGLGTPDDLKIFMNKFFANSIS